MQIAETGSWLNPTNEGHCFDGSLANSIAIFCNNNNLEWVIDLGCGDGSYVNYFNTSHFNLIAMGCDGNPHTADIANKGQKMPFCYTMELHKPFTINKKKCDLLISLEVGEHIPAEYEQVFLDNICNNAKDWIILSWAIPGQTGDGHVNCRENSYIIGQMLQRGFAHDKLSSLILREEASLPWFKDTLMVFKRIQL